MNKRKLMKISGNVSGMNRALKILSLVSNAVKILSAAVIVYTAADSFLTLKKS